MPDSEALCKVCCAGLPEAVLEDLFSSGKGAVYEEGEAKSQDLQYYFFFVFFSQVD